VGPGGEPLGEERRDPGRRPAAQGFRVVEDDHEILG
jgi:hypothetical protein